MEVFQVNGYSNILNSFKQFSTGLEQILGLLERIDIKETAVGYPNEHFTVEDLDFPDIEPHHLSGNKSVNNQ